MLTRVSSTFQVKTEPYEVSDDEQTDISEWQQPSSSQYGEKTEDNAIGLSRRHGITPEDSDLVTSRYLPELPAYVQAKMPPGKRTFSGCIQKCHKDVTIYLLDADLWANFKQVGTEMIITKKGRRVFPVPSYVICNLDPNKLYNVTLDLMSVDNAVHKFINGEWITSKEGSHIYPTPVPGRGSYLHPFSPNTGAHWMREPITFSALKISNNLEALGTIVLQSMRKYEMWLVISELGGSMTAHIPQPETHFVAVTQYQNDKVTQMKIEHNPFANGFRFASNKTKEKSRKLISQDTDTDEDMKAEGSSSNTDVSSPPLPLTYSVPSLPPGRSDISSSLPSRLSDYLNEKRATFKQLLPEYFDQLKSESYDRTRQSRRPHLDPSIHDYSVWPPTVMPPQENAFTPFDKSPKTEVPLGHFMCHPGEGNPLAQIRQLGDMNRSLDMESPLSLVKNNKRLSDYDAQEDEEIKHSRREGMESLEMGHRTSENGRKRRSTYGSSDGLFSHNQPDFMDRGHWGAVYNPTPDDRLGVTIPTDRQRRSLTSYWSVEVDDIERDSLTPTDLTMKNNYDSNSILSRPPRPLDSISKPDVTLKNRDLWATTHEVVVSSEGRPMFPFISLNVSKLDARRPYYISLQLVPTSRWLYDYTDYEWTPCQKTSKIDVISLYQHPDNPRLGHEWESGVLFDRLRLSTTRHGKNMLKVHLRRQYFPLITVRAAGQDWQYPLKDAIFITVCIDKSQYFKTGPNENYQAPCQEPARALADNLLRSSQRKQTNPKRMYTDSDTTDPAVPSSPHSSQAYKVNTTNETSEQSFPLALSTKYSNLKDKAVSPSSSSPPSPSSAVVLNHKMCEDFPKFPSDGNTRETVSNGKSQSVDFHKSPKTGSRCHILPTTKEDNSIVSPVNGANNRGFCTTPRNNVLEPEGEDTRYSEIKTSPIKLSPSKWTRKEACHQQVDTSET